MRTLHNISRPRRSLFPLLLVIAAACGSDATAPDDTPEATSVDLYALQSVDGDPLPFLVPQGAPAIVEVTAGSAILRSNGTCSLSETSRIDFQGSVTTDVNDLSCTWTESGSAITLTFSDHTFTGSLVDNTLTITQEGLPWVYLKQ